MLLTLSEEIKKDRDMQYRRWKSERRDFVQRRRHEDYHNRKHYQYKLKAQQNQRNHEERTANSHLKQFIKIHNLHYEVTKDQLEMIFSQCGRLKTCRIDWDKMGRSKETATVEYFNKQDEQRAFKELNNHILEGQSIKLELVSQQASFPNKKHEISKQYSAYRTSRQYRK